MNGEGIQIEGNIVTIQFNLQDMIDKAVEKAREQTFQDTKEVLEKREKLTVKMISNEYNVGSDTVIRWIDTGIKKSGKRIKLRATKLTDGGKYNITRHDLNTFLKETGRQVN